MTEKVEFNAIQGTGRFLCRLWGPTDHLRDPLFWCYVYPRWGILLSGTRIIHTRQPLRHSISIEGSLDTIRLHERRQHHCVRQLRSHLAPWFRAHCPLLKNVPSLPRQTHECSRPRNIVNEGYHNLKQAHDLLKISPPARPDRVPSMFCYCTDRVFVGLE